LKPPWKPGQSGNPSGLSKEAFALAAAARERLNLALAALDRAVVCGDSRVEIVAARELLDRGFGKPIQTVDQTVHYPTIEVRNFGPPLDIERPAPKAPENGNGKPAHN
jgi:hypothetical protein